MKGVTEGELAALELRVRAGVSLREWKALFLIAAARELEVIRAAWRGPGGESYWLEWCKEHFKEPPK